jgi:hypothetical protein
MIDTALIQRNDVATISQPPNGERCGFFGCG